MADYNLESCSEPSPNKIFKDKNKRDFRDKIAEK